MPLRQWSPTVTVLLPWKTALHYVGGYPFGDDETNRVLLTVGERLEKWDTTLSVTGPSGQDVALIHQDGGTILLLGDDYRTLVVNSYLYEQKACDAQDHDSVEEWHACRDCFPDNLWWEQLQPGDQ